MVYFPDIRELEIFRENKSPRKLGPPILSNERKKEKRQNLSPGIAIPSTKGKINSGEIK